MFERAKRFVQNHWKKVVFGGVALQAVSYGIRYAANQLIAYQEDQAKQFWQRTKRQQCFEKLDERSTNSFREMWEAMKLHIGEELDAESLQDKITNNQVKDKLKAWDELKIIVVTRIITSVYASSLLYVLIRIQLSVIAGYLTQTRTDSVALAASSNSTGPEGTPPLILDNELQEKYFQLTDAFVSSGAVKLCRHVRGKVEQVFGSVPLKQSVTISDLEQLLWAAIRKETSSPDPTVFPWMYIFPEEILGDQSFFTQTQTSNNYNKIVCDTYDLLESEDVRNILRYFESQGMSHFTDRISEMVSTLPEQTGVSTSPENDLVEPKVAVAKLIPLMAALHLFDVQSDAWVNLLTEAESVRVLSSNVYEAFCME